MMAAVVARPAHPDKDIEAAVAEAEARGWRWRRMGHWCRMFCPHADRDGCQFGVNGTPRNGGDHARQILRAVDRCPHVKGDHDGDV